MVYTRTYSTHTYTQIFTYFTYGYNTKTSAHETVNWMVEQIIKRKKRYMERDGIDGKGH